jgi:hypothetical protein
VALSRQGRLKTACCQSVKGVTTPQRVETEEELRTPPEATPYFKMTQRNKIAPHTNR